MTNLRHSPILSCGHHRRPRSSQANSAAPRLVQMGETATSPCANMFCLPALAGGQQMVGEAELLRVTADLYEAALVPQQWPLALANLAEFCGARWGVMGMFPRNGPPSTWHFP